jgi:hypothetical protein
MPPPIPAPVPTKPHLHIWVLPISPYGKIFTKALAWSLLFAALAGVCGLSSHFDALFAAPKFNVLLLMAGGIYLFWTLAVDMWRTAANGQALIGTYTGLWEPIQMLLCLCLLIPVAGGASLFSSLFLAFMHGAAAL